MYFCIWFHSKFNVLPALPSNQLFLFHQQSLEFPKTNHISSQTIHKKNKNEINKNKNKLINKYKNIKNI